MLAAGQRGRVESSGVVAVVIEADLDRWTEWAPGGILLEGMTVGDAALELGRRFGVPVEVRGADLDVLCSAGRGGESQRGPCVNVASKYV
ncbi:MAG: hypothetical protein ACJ79A_16925 [Gemmatimonadaceae bacterium]